MVRWVQYLEDIELGALNMSQEAVVEIPLSIFDTQYSSDIPASLGEDLGPKRGDESRGNWPEREAVRSAFGCQPWLDLTIQCRTSGCTLRPLPDREALGINKKNLVVLEYDKLGITYVLGLQVYAESDNAEQENHRR